MKISIDSSLLASAGSAIGRIHGSVNLVATPSIGSSISFLYPQGSATFPAVVGFDGLLRVAAVQFAANCESDGVLALLDDIVVPSRQDGLGLAAFLQEGFGLFWEEYDAE